jgi:hypothetical protein
MARPWSMVHLQSSPAHRWNLESALTGACFGAAQAWPQQRLRSRRRSKSTGREFEAPPACHSHDSVTGPPRNARHVSRLAPLAHLHMHKTQMMHRQHGLPPPPPPLRVITSQRAEPRVQTIADTALGCPSAGLPIRPLPIRVGPLIWWNALRCAVHCNAALFPPSLSFDQNLAEHWRWYVVGGEALPFLFLGLPKRAVPELNPGTTLDWRHGFPAGSRSSRLPPSRAGLRFSRAFCLALTGLFPCRSLHGSRSVSLVGWLVG